MKEPTMLSVRPQFMGITAILAHGLDFLTFWMALELFGVPIAAEQNPLMVGSYLAGGYLLVFATKAALVGLMLALLARVSARPALPPFLLIYVLGLVGATANLIAIHSFSGF